jgi:3-carboxy-cis,cis-muconate cycloisomerase
MTAPLFVPAALARAFSPAVRIGRMLDVEAALARAEASLGVVPPEAADAIAAQCDVALYDVDALTARAVTAGNLAIPLVAALTARVGDADAPARGYVHWGATSQDIIDTGLVLQLRDGLDFIEPELARLCEALATQADAHRRTVMPGRTWLQQASPVTFGAKLAGVLDALERERDALAAVRRETLVVQFGGAVGNLAALGDRGLAVMDALARELSLGVPRMPWHTQRDRLCRCAAALGTLTATLGKLAHDLALLAQTEVGEASEPVGAGRGGSSTMPQKRNPVGCSIALAAATRVPGLVATMLTAAVQEHERGLGNWPAEWDTLPQIVQLAGASVVAMAEVVAGLQVDAARMRDNLDVTHGQVYAEAVQMALAGAMGRDAAHRLVADIGQRAAAAGLHLRDALSHDATVRKVLDDAALGRLFDPLGYVGQSEALLERVLKSRR